MLFVPAWLWPNSSTTVLPTNPSYSNSCRSITPCSLCIHRARRGPPSAWSTPRGYAVRIYFATRIPASHGAYAKRRNFTFHRISSPTSALSDSIAYGSAQTAATQAQIAATRHVVKHSPADAFQCCPLQNRTD